MVKVCCAAFEVRAVVLQGIVMIASALLCSNDRPDNSVVFGTMTCSGVELQIKHARELRKDHQEVLPKDTTDRELLKKAGRYQVLFVLSNCVSL